MTAEDSDWAEVARASRGALAELGYDIGPRCLPGEPEACGGSFSQHVAAHLATIKAVADHQLAHLGPPPGMVDDIYRTVTASLKHGDGVRS